MRQRPQNVLERPFVHACARVVPNQPMSRVRTMAERSDRGSDLRIQSGQVGFRHPSFVGFSRCASPAGSASTLSYRCPQLSSTPTCWLLLIYSLTPANAYLFSLGGHSSYQTRQEDIARDLVYSLGLQFSNQPQTK